MLVKKLFIILFLHQTTTRSSRWTLRRCCLSSCSYIKPQPTAPPKLSVAGCLSSCSYIKPQLDDRSLYISSVVYHLVPTSNHNFAQSIILVITLFIILFLHQTTTFAGDAMSPSLLFIILFLHQTTTLSNRWAKAFMLFIILFLHQTTTYSRKSTGNQ